MNASYARRALSRHCPGALPGSTPFGGPPPSRHARNAASSCIAPHRTHERSMLSDDTAERPLGGRVVDTSPLFVLGLFRGTISLEWYMNMKRGRDVFVPRLFLRNNARRALPAPSRHIDDMSRRWAGITLCEAPPLGAAMPLTRVSGTEPISSPKGRRLSRHCPDALPGANLLLSGTIFFFIVFYSLCLV
jgi:hypothetical protein